VPILDDVLRPGLRVVFCGSAVGTVSARRGAYYAGPGNQFWPVLFRAGFTSRQLLPLEYKTVVEFGIGLTDINKIESGADRSLTRSASDAAGLHAKILQYAPNVLAFNGKRAAQAYFAQTRKPLQYGRQIETIGKTAIFVLPSTSGAARGFWNEDHWRALAAFLRIEKAPNHKDRGFTTSSPD
jgi:TDG/mug DNA glycosylase family protein